MCECNNNQQTTFTSSGIDAYQYRARASLHRIDLTSAIDQGYAYSNSLAMAMTLGLEVVFIFAFEEMWIWVET